jgi:predicted transcriptional regulator/energy-coupling factor transporter ATP-binding protein EcfA2
MRFRDRPLLPDTLDGELYLPRPRLEDSLLRPLTQGRNVLLLGAAGSGKTSLMRQVLGRLEAEDGRTAWVNGALTDDTEELLEAVADALSEPGEVPRLGHPPNSNALLELTRAIGRRPETVIALDGLRDEKIAFDLFGRLRDELWAAGHAWLVASRPQDATKLRMPPADAFWAKVVEIAPLDHEETEEFLRRGLEPQEFEDIGAERPPAGLHPRLLIREAEGHLEGRGSGRLERLQQLIDAAAEIGRSESMAMVELIELGHPASAHDAEMLERLGWSRAYAQRILSSLESAGLVRSIHEPAGERPGRPRKLYEPDVSGG